MYSHQKREEKVRALLKQLADDTSLHGFKQIHDNRGPRKWIWLVALILALILVTILFRTTVNDYLNYKTYIGESDTRMNGKKTDNRKTGKQNISRPDNWLSSKNKQSNKLSPIFSPIKTKYREFFLP